jgi:hypothetical protein
LPPQPRTALRIFPQQNRGAPRRTGYAKEKGIIRPLRTISRRRRQQVTNGASRPGLHGYIGSQACLPSESTGPSGEPSVLFAVQPWGGVPREEITRGVDRGMSQAHTFCGGARIDLARPHCGRSIALTNPPRKPQLWPNLALSYGHARDARRKVSRWVHSLFS